MTVQILTIIVETFKIQLVNGPTLPRGRGIWHRKRGRREMQKGNIATFPFRPQLGIPELRPGGEADGGPTCLAGGTQLVAGAKARSTQ